MLAASALLSFAALTVPDNGPLPHEVEIRLFAEIAALAELASTQCADILINNRMMAEMKERMHIRPMDGPAVLDEAHKSTEVLKQDIAKAADRQSWCANIYRLYGPTGKQLPNLMLRDTSTPHPSP